MAYDFPNSPTLNQIVVGPAGQQFKWDGVKWIALLGGGGSGSGGGGLPTNPGTTPPSNPTQGMLWYDTTNNTLFVYDGSSWVVVSGSGGVTATNPGTTPPSNPVEGMLWYNTSNNTLNVYNGTAWVPVATGTWLPVNNPQFTGVLSSSDAVSNSENVGATVNIGPNGFIYAMGNPIGLYAPYGIQGGIVWAGASFRGQIWHQSLPGDPVIDLGDGIDRYWQYLPTEDRMIWVVSDTERFWIIGATGNSGTQGTFTAGGIITAGADAVNPKDVVTLEQLQAAIAGVGGGNYLPLTGGTLTGDLTINAQVPQLTLLGGTAQAIYLGTSSPSGLVQWSGGGAGQLNVGVTPAPGANLTFYTNGTIDMRGNGLFLPQGVLGVGTFASAPTTNTPVDGYIYYDTTLNKLRVYCNNAWQTIQSS